MNLTAFSLADFQSPHKTGAITRTMHADAIILVVTKQRLLFTFDVQEEPFSGLSRNSLSSCVQIGAPWNIFFTGLNASLAMCDSCFCPWLYKLNNRRFIMRKEVCKAWGLQRNSRARI